ncbi:putative pentatricopeptide repeat-containing protein, mitochondrial-like [Capsicum annuum]|nr:putative pentatricopeptide repeat-containing protein, mitochondrial-like [Capsicum annuum]
MAKCCSFTASRNWLFKYSFANSGLKSSTKDLGDGTIMHCWIPKTHKEKNPTLLLIHGIGANAMWQWNEFITALSSGFNLYVPDLLFFGESYTSRCERTESFQAQCVMRTMEAYGVKKMIVVGLSYGGFVGYSMAAQYPEAVEKLVLGCSGVCLEEKDMENGMFQVKSVEEAVSILLPQTPEKLRQLLRLSFYKPAKNVPSCFLNDFIDISLTTSCFALIFDYLAVVSVCCYCLFNGCSLGTPSVSSKPRVYWKQPLYLTKVMCTVNHQERKELIEALHNKRKFADLPKITQPTLIIWGEYDQIFPLELGHRLKRHLGENAQLVIIKGAGHAINMEKPKELYKHLKSFLLDSHPHTKENSNGNTDKLD